MTFAIFPFVILSTFGDRETLDGYTRQMIITYYVLIPLISSVTVSYVWDNAGHDVREGTIAQYVTKPLSYVNFLFWSESGIKILRLILILPLVLAILPFVHTYIHIPDLSAVSLVSFVVIIMFGTAIGFLTASILGAFSCWTTRADWVLQAWWIISTFAAGYVAPITLYPLWLQKSISYLPFSLMVDVPIRTLLGTITTPEIISAGTKGLVWIAVLFGINKILWHQGLKRVDVVGI